MKTILHVSAMLAMVLGCLSVPVAGQIAPSAAHVAADAAGHFDVAANFTYKAAKISQTTNRFVMPGGSVDAAYNFGGKLGGLSAVVDLNGESASNIEPGVDLTQFSIMGGARYTFRLNRKNAHVVALYGQILGGEDFASNSAFPGLAAFTSTANSSAFQAGGGANMRLTRSISFRLLEADFITTALPNAANNRQDSLRLSNGIVFHF